jgi:glutaredoxin-related protein
MTNFKQYMEALFMHTKNEIFITDKTTKLEKEVFENSVKIAVPEFAIADISWQLFENLFYEVKQNAKQQLSKNSLHINMIFYVWLDAQAGQLRYNFINSNHKALPFTGKLNFLKDSYQVSNAFVKLIQERIYPENDEVYIYQQIITRKINFDFIPNERLGNIKFGNTMAEARAAVGIPYKAFQKSMDHYSPADAFDDSSFTVFYDKNDTVEAIEIYKEAQIKWNDFEIIGSAIVEVEKKMNSLADDVKNEDNFFVSRKLGLMISGNGDGNPTETNVGYVLVHRLGYWDEYDASQPKSWEFIPNKAVGPIAFGSSKEQVIKILSLPSIEKQNRLHFEALEIEIQFNEQNQCAQVIIHNSDKVAIKYDFVASMNSGGLTALTDFLKERATDIIFDANGCNIPSLGLAVNNPGYTIEETKYQKMKAITFYVKALNL